jgi:hypothetical protein
MGCMPLLLLFQLHILIACEGSEKGISFPHRRWPQTKQGATRYVVMTQVMIPMKHTLT